MTHAATFEAAVRGATCTGLLVQEAWYQGELTEPANLVFLQLDGVRWVRCYVDAGFFSWCESEAPAAIPYEVVPEFRFPLVDASVAFPILGAWICRGSTHRASSVERRLRVATERRARAAAP